MELSKVDTNERLVGGGGIVLLVALFLSWYGVTGLSVNGVNIHANTGYTLNGWDSISVGRWLFLITAVLAIILAITESNGQQLNLPVTPSVMLAGLGGLSVLWIVLRILIHPEGGLSLSAKYGIFVALVGAALLTFGARRSMHEDGASFDELQRYTERFTKPRA